MTDVEITIRPNGPAVVRGRIRLLDGNGVEFDTAGRETVVLCRCGGSTNKPFCDGTHSRIGFNAATEAVRKAVERGE